LGDEGRAASGGKFLVFLNVLDSESHVNTLAAGLNQAVRKKQLIRTWLCG